MQANERLFIGVYPAGIVYADRKKEEHGDYKRLAFLPYDTLELDIKKGVPASLRKEILAHAMRIQSMKGQPFSTSASGSTVMLGSRNKSGGYRGSAWKTRAPFLINGKWKWIVWTTKADDPSFPPGEVGNKHAVILKKARELNAEAWDFGQADHMEAGRANYAGRATAKHGTSRRVRSTPKHGPEKRVRSKPKHGTANRSGHDTTWQIAEKDRKKTIMSIYKSTNTSDKMLRNKKHIVMLMGQTARNYGVGNYYNVTLEDLSNAELYRLAYAMELFGSQKAGR